MSIKLRDGIEIHLSDGTVVVCDADSPDADIGVVSHAHGDHLPENDTEAVCSRLTASLGETRLDTSLQRITDDRIELLPSGHVAGSRAAKITDPDGTEYLYTGDVCTRSRLYLDGFDPSPCDVLIIEATYGEPQYEFPPHDKLEKEIVSWLNENDQPVLLFGYALGRAQKLQLIAEKSTIDTIYTTDAVCRVNRVIENHIDVTFDSETFSIDKDLTSNDAVVLPMTSARVDWIDKLASKEEAIKAGFSGWAVNSSFKFRGDFDTVFPLSDHCDHTELVALVESVDPDHIFTNHGAAETLASELTKYGYDATALRQNQTVLSSF